MHNVLLYDLIFLFLVFNNEVLNVLVLQETVLYDQ